MIITLLASGLSIPLNNLSPAWGASCNSQSFTLLGDGTNGTTNGISYTVESITATGTCDWLVPRGVDSVTVLVVGGGGGGGGGSIGTGGGGGAAGAGGGGAGGTVKYTSKSVSNLSSISVTIGSGGSGGAPDNTTRYNAVAGTSGGNSYFAISVSDSVTAFGGSGGGVGTTNTGASAGGDGGSNADFSGGTNNWEGAGGGAGAGGNGANGTDIGGAGGNGANGGSGISVSITLSATVYGGGGGGGGTPGSNDLGSAGSGGSGGGGQGGTQTLPNPQLTTSGTDGLGGGGGGGAGFVAATTREAAGGSGGSGLVVIRYLSISITRQTPSSCSAITITSLSPSGGTSSGGTRLTIYGSGLTPFVYINGRVADVRLASSSSVTIRTPAGTKGSANIRIDGCDTSASTTYLFDPDPVISSLSTSSISTSGGAITITGTFLSGASITIGTTKASIISNTDTLISASLPPALAGQKVMTLTTPFGSTTSKLNFIEPPSLKATLPSGYIAQGDLVLHSFATTGASSYSSSATLPPGLTLNPTTGSLSGIATKEGIYNFFITATNAAGSDTKNYTLDIDRPTPMTITANLYFSHKNTSLSPSNKANLDRLIARINSVAPRNLSATITFTGGAGNVGTILAATRQNQIKNYLIAQGIKIGTTNSATGSANKVAISVGWSRL